MKKSELIDLLNSDETTRLLGRLYGSDEETVAMQRKRYINAVEEMSSLFPSGKDYEIFSAPGRTEIGGNHTDHQHGCVLAAAVDLDAVGVASFHNEGVIRIASAGYEPFEVELSDLSVHSDEKGSAAIVRGIAAAFAKRGVIISGFDMYTTSNVAGGSGVSSSAAFETLVGTAIDLHYNDGKCGAVEIAKIGQYAENVYFGKKSGLMDQMVSSVGGLVSIDFNDTEDPEITIFDFDFEKVGYALLLTDTKGSHADLTNDYADIRTEMECVAAQFGKEYLRQVDKDEFYSALPSLRRKCSDRALLRAAHYFEESDRAVYQTAALMKGNTEDFLALVRESGDSSALLLQNLYSNSRPTMQEIPLAIMLGKRVLGGRGAVRVHGGGFAGTVQAFVPLELEADYISVMESVFGSGSCRRLRIRPAGGIRIAK